MSSSEPEEEWKEENCFKKGTRLGGKRIHW
jgi:hypothetical protein